MGFGPASNIPSCAGAGDCRIKPTAVRSRKCSLSVVIPAPLSRRRLAAAPQSTAGNSLAGTETTSYFDKLSMRLQEKPRPEPVEGRGFGPERRQYEFPAGLSG